jgi:hypothetical protein
MATTTRKTKNAIEAYGVKGMSSKPWRKEFRDHEAMAKWVERNDAEVHGARAINEEGAAAQPQEPDLLTLLRDVKTLWDEAGLGDDPERSEDVYNRLNRAIALASAPASEEKILELISTLAGGLADRYAQNRIAMAVQDVKDRRAGKDVSDADLG